MIEVDDIRARFRQAAKFLDERGRRLFAANEALAIGYGGVTAAAAATGLARSTIRRAILELQGGSNPIGQRIRRPGGGRKRAVVLQPGLPAALEVNFSVQSTGPAIGPVTVLEPFQVPA